MFTGEAEYTCAFTSGVTDEKGLYCLELFRQRPRLEVFVAFTLNAVPRAFPASFRRTPADLTHVEEAVAAPQRSEVEHPAAGNVRPHS